MISSSSLSLIFWIMFVLSYAAALPSSAAEINPLDELLSDPFIAAGLAKRSAPFPKERCDYYFGSPDSIDCVRAIKNMYNSVPPAARDSYDTFTNDTHIPGLEARSTQVIPAAWYGPLGKCALRVSINDELDLSSDDQWDLSTWKTVQLESVAVIAHCVDYIPVKTGGTQIIGHNNRINITIYDPRNSGYELQVAKNTWQLNTALSERPGLSTILQNVTGDGFEGSSGSGSSGKSQTTPTARHANYCTSNIACEVNHQMGIMCKVFDIGRKLLHVFFGAAEKPVLRGVCEGGFAIAVRRDVDRSLQPYRSTSNKPAPGPTVDLTTYCQQRPSVPGCIFRSSVQSTINSIFCRDSRDCASDNKGIIGTCVLISISATLFFLLLGISRAMATYAVAAAALAAEAEEQRLQDAAHELMAEGLRQLACLRDDELTNRGLGGQCSGVGTCQWEERVGRRRRRGSAQSSQLVTTISATSLVNRERRSSSAPRTQADLERYCRTHGTQFGCIAGHFVSYSFCTDPATCLSTQEYIGKCALAAIGASMFAVLFGMRVVAGFYEEDARLNEDWEIMTEGMRFLDCLVGNELTN